MRKNHSPWIHQLDANRSRKVLDRDLETDVAIVGAGIAGVATAFFILKYTDKRVALVERFKLAHGATGHNAGQVVSYFERGFASLAQEFGLQATAKAERDIVGAWELLDEMYTDAGLDIPFSRFIGHGGLTSFQQVQWHLDANRLRRQAGNPVRELLISETAPFVKAIPNEYEGTYRIVPHREILDLLETEKKVFVAVISYQKGCINSALLCQEVVAYLLATYPERFALYEHSRVHKILLHKEYAILDVEKHTIDALRVVLCTNGFEDLHLINEHGLGIDAKYHHLLHGKIGYMSGYLEAMNKPPMAISYYLDPSASMANEYVYLTRRPYEYEKGAHHNLISVGGPTEDIDDTSNYTYEGDFPEEAEEALDRFIHQVYDWEPNRKIDYLFTWHGLMGYTRNGVRLIGPEPKNPVLLYNLGCNGIGILPSLHGGRQIARHIGGERVEKSIFDVPVR